ncbi:sugar ABC transporter ATP-binding protein [Rhodoferax ferrireducens]|uniref:sugar ABC transporter ATP-binding protein n=1 Tax=Rhodoferax ferrireducens TaxID=192843 RepID=UPI0018E4E996|nr:sugar ABC transporter ATP-binding protein [Rhodoferax ferrireducens]
MSPLLRMQGVSKRYSGVRALENAGLECGRGRIHAVLGENGAGKSTLIKVMSGVVIPDAGRIEFDGQPIVLDGPASASRAGIVSVFQELSLMPDLSVADNIGITNPPRRFGFIDQRAQRRLAEQALARVGCEDVHPLALVRDLPLSRRQMVEIAKAVGRKPKLMILDEATSALTAADVQRVFALLKQLRDEGLAIVYISHRMSEIDELADDCSVYRNGRHVASFTAGTKTSDEIVEMMIGREVSHAFPPKPASRGAADGSAQKVDDGKPPTLDVKHLNWGGRLHDIDLSVRAGEIVGLGGLDGQGQREFFFALFGVLRGVSGQIQIDGRTITVDSPRAAKQADIGIALVPEDRKTDGLMLPMSVRDNLTFAALERLSLAGVIRFADEARATAEMVNRLSIKVPDTADAVSTLSGGNQQKVVIGKWLLNAPRVMLLNDPTRGIDVGTKQDIYRLLRKLADDGVAVLLYSTDYAELIGCCDRVAVFFDGRVVCWLQGDDMTEHALVASALNLGVTV